MRSGLRSRNGQSNSNTGGISETNKPERLREIFQQLVGGEEIPFRFDAFRRLERIGLLAEFDGQDTIKVTSTAINTQNTTPL
jgi:hypothetical protein